MKKVALVLSLFVLTLISCGKQDSATRLKSNSMISNLVIDETLDKSQNEKLLVQLQKAGMSQIKFSSLRQVLGNIDIANYAIEGSTQIVLVETLHHNVNVKGFNKMIDNFNLLYASDNEVLMKSYQLYSDENCRKIYGCVGNINDSEYDWKIIKFLPNPERCTFEPTITMSNVMLYK